MIEPHPKATVYELGHHSARHGSAEMAISTHLPPPVITESAASLALVTHILCWACAMCFFGRGLFRERPGQHEFGLEHRAGIFNAAVESGPPSSGSREAVKSEIAEVSQRMGPANACSISSTIS